MIQNLVFGLYRVANQGGSPDAPPRGSEGGEGAVGRVGLIAGAVALLAERPPKHLAGFVAGHFCLGRGLPAQLGGTARCLRRLV